MNPVLDIHIVYLDLGLYEVYFGDQPVSPAHGSISEAIRYCGNEIPPSYSQFANLSYSGVSLGTRYIPHFVKDAELLAAELVELVELDRDVRHSIEEMKFMALQIRQRNAF